ncbi:hypothetical protein [Pedobacter sp. SYP-B3415]|uniref:hypothetical protein n=1 Tax=Pedobacter sp. SYP-B3415 TaxID=2496641 RepID=UPI00101B7746|nr:hypothetical protein [Pedobacter sp. SYP-B3415]
MKLKFALTLTMILVAFVAAAQRISAVRLNLNAQNPQWQGLLVAGNRVLFELDASGKQLDVNIEDDYTTDGSPLTTAGPDIFFEYYDRFDGEFAGKLKSAGGFLITYYGRFDPQQKQGRVKSIGTVRFDYYDVFDTPALAGKMKSAGHLALSYFDQFSGEESRGKLRAVGNLTFSYYDRFTRPDLAGRIRSVKGHLNGIRIIR